MSETVKSTFGGRLALIASQRTLFEYSAFLERLLVGLADESIPVVLVCPPDCEVDAVVSGIAQVIRHPVFELPFTEHLNRKILVEQLAEFEPAILHCLCESNASLTMHLAGELGLPYVLTVNSLRKQWSRLPISQEHCARIIVPAKSIAESVAKTYPQFADRTRQINIGTFVQEKNNCFSNPSRLASVVVVPADGELDNVDDFENLFNAVRHLMIDRYEFMVVVVGEGRAEKQLRKLLTTLDLLQIVTIVGRLKPWHSVFAAGDIFIQPQPTSSFNPLLVEAMSVGAAVAACKGGVDDLIIENQTAVVFDPNDELSIKSTLQELFDKREFARKIAKEAQNYLRENHTVSKMISGMLQSYDDAVRWLKASARIDKIKVEIGRKKR
jgi:glycosyltransferase involved in cell wall biosynthesis